MKPVKPTHLQVNLDVRPDGTTVPARSLFPQEVTNLMRGAIAEPFVPPTMQLKVAPGGATKAPHISRGFVLGRAGRSTRAYGLPTAQASSSSSASSLPPDDFGKAAPCVIARPLRYSMGTLKFAPT